jgi:hypothetical protein
VSSSSLDNLKVINQDNQMLTLLSDG